MIRTPRTRALIACCGLACCFTAFSARLVHLQVTMHDFYLAKAHKDHGVRQVLAGRRGAITDIHGEALAQNEPVKTVVVDAGLVKDPALLADVLAKTLGVAREKIFAQMTRETWSATQEKNVRSSYIVVKKEVPQDVVETLTAQLVQGKKMRGVSFEQSANRIYPNGPMLCHVLGFLGFVDGKSEAVDGIERTMDSFLRSHAGFRCIELTRKGNEILPYRGEEHDARNGGNVRLTIDMGLQNIVEQELDAAVKQFRPKGATVIMMNPKTGEILALANRPNFNLNEPVGRTEENRRNRAVTDQVEPGSTFKIVTTAAVLSEKLVTPEMVFETENGYYEWCKLKDHHPYAELTVHDILVHSSNIGVAKLAMRLGDQKFFEYIHRFGFGEQTGVALPGEAKGTIHPPHLWSKISITRMPMGQEVAATPLQIVTAMGAIANGGMLMMPQIVHDITDDAGNVVSAFPPREVRRVVSQKSTEQVRSALMEVVSKRGTARLAQVLGYKVAGKTGTAQKYDPVTHLPYHDKHVCSFVGYMPAEDPAFVVLVLIDEAQTKREQDVGGMVAAPVFSRIGERAARYLGLTPTPEEPEGSIVAKGSKDGGDFRDQ